VLSSDSLAAHPAIMGSSIIIKDVDKVICWSIPADFRLV
jgi:hypothetical protein